MVHQIFHSALCVHYFWGDWLFQISVTPPWVFPLSLLLSSLGFPGGTSDKEATCQCRRHRRCRFDPWVRKIPWRRKWQPTPVSCLEDPMDRGAWWATVHGVAKSQTRLKWLSTLFCVPQNCYQLSKVQNQSMLGCLVYWCGKFNLKVQFQF